MVVAFATMRTMQPLTLITDTWPWKRAMRTEPFGLAGAVIVTDAPGMSTYSVEFAVALPVVVSSRAIRTTMLPFAASWDVTPKTVAVPVMRTASATTDAVSHRLRMV